MENCNNASLHAGLKQSHLCKLDMQMKFPHKRVCYLWDWQC